MKKNRTMRAAVLMLALTLITSCFVGSTFAKYTTGMSASDTARVAKFGVTLTTDTVMFYNQYDGSGDLSVKSDDDADVIAPGTTGTAFDFSISGAPEVAVKIVATLGAFTRVTLPVGDYLDFTTANNTTDTFNIAAEYVPVKWTLSFNGTPVTGCEKVKLDVIDNYLENTLSGEYAVGDFAAICGTYNLTWEWDFGVADADPSTNDKADTFLANKAANDAIVTPSGYVANETFYFSLRVEQVDVETPPTP